MPLELIQINPTVVSKFSKQFDNLFLDQIECADKLFKTLGIKGVSNTWLAKMEWKRSVAALVYQDLIAVHPNPKDILEIGGNLSAITLSLLKHNNYSLVEKATHELTEDYRTLEKYLKKDFAVISDWNTFKPASNYDIIIANDLFPNVDMRLYDFIDRYAACTREMRLVLTYYENTAFEVERIGSGEQLTVVPWGLDSIRIFFKWFNTKYPQFCSNAECKKAIAELGYVDYQGTLFGNKRNVIYCKFTTR
jgi:hypothetical protein